MVFKVYGCGSNGKYQLGNGTDDDLDFPELVFETETAVSKVVCGGNHSFILLKNGDLFASGDNSKGQCGVTAVQSLESFTKLDGTWKDCSAGYEFSILVNEHNEVYSCGFGLKGELGTGEGISQSSLKKLSIEFQSDVTSVKSCLDHTVLLLSDGSLFVWGNGRNGKLIEVENKIWQPKLIQIPGFKITKVEVGRDFTLLSDSKTVKLFGKDRYGIQSNIPPVYSDFKTMWSSVHFNQDGKIISIGNNSHGQTLESDQQLQFDDFQVGSEHGLLLSSNKVYSWGWGEHGNCGKMQSESTTFDLSLLFEKSQETIVKLQGGCATSWVITSC